MDERRPAYTLEDYFPYIIKVISGVTGRYVEVENSIELGIALEKFASIEESYDVSKGPFMPYLKKVIKNALIDYMKSEKTKQTTHMDPDIPVAAKNSEVLVSAQLMAYEKALKTYRIDFVSLSEKAPVHQLTRKKLVEIARKIALDDEVVRHLTGKKRLPITMIASKYTVSLKVVKSHKIYLMAIVIAYVEGIDPVIDWIEAQM